MKGEARSCEWLGKTIWPGFLFLQTTENRSKIGLPRASCPVFIIVAGRSFLQCRFSVWAGGRQVHLSRQSITVEPRWGNGTDVGTPIKLVIAAPEGMGRKGKEAAGQHRHHIYARPSTYLFNRPRNAFTVGGGPLLEFRTAHRSARFEATSGVPWFRGERLRASSRRSLQHCGLAAATAHATLPAYAIEAFSQGIISVILIRGII